MSIINNFSVKLLQNSILNICFNQTKNKSYLNRPKIRNPIWFQTKLRVQRITETITPENKHFIKEVVNEKFGPPTLIKGVIAHQNAASLLKSQELAPQEWLPGYQRTGVVARKIGQYPLWKKDGTKIRTTLLQVLDNHVIKYIPPGEFDPKFVRRIETRRIVNKFGCLLIGSETIDPNLLTKEYIGLFKDSGVMPKKNITRFMVSPQAALLPGTPINVSHFRVGDFIDVRGRTVYHGFQGVCFRHGFKGQPASHGVTKTHRRPGNIGGGGEKGRVWPGQKMPGHMGRDWRVAKGLKIWRINTKYNVMWVQGSAIPGETNNLVYIHDTILPLRKPKTAPPFPTFLGNEEELPEDIWAEELHDFQDKTIVYEETK